MDTYKYTNYIHYYKIDLVTSYNKAIPRANTVRKKTIVHNYIRRLQVNQNVLTQKIVAVPKIG